MTCRRGIIGYRCELCFDPSVVCATVLELSEYYNSGVVSTTTEHFEIQIDIEDGDPDLCLVFVKCKCI